MGCVGIRTAVAAADDALGAGLERTVRAHHRRRLGALGQLPSLEPPFPGAKLWAAGEPPPRAGNDLRLLVDGATALPEIAASISQARSHVHIAGWHASPEFSMGPTATPVPLRALLAEAAERVDVRLLLWAGPPLPLFKPTRPMVRAAQAEFVRGTRVQCRLDARERTMHCHHEKIVVVDDEVAFVGGIDLTALGGDRFDTPAHRPRGRLGWHDGAVRLRGPAVADVGRHFAQRWSEVTGAALPAPLVPSTAGSVEVQVVRTVPEATYRFAPRGEFRILETYCRALASAERLVYLENQFLWSPEIVDILVEKLRRPPTEEFRVLLVLPARPNNGADTTRGQLGRLLDADADSGRLLATTVRCYDGRQSGPLYVHAKIGVVDDRWMSIGSANLNEHSLFNDTEMNVVSCDPSLARSTRLALWAEHLQLDQGQLQGEAHHVIDGIWRPIADEQFARRRAGAEPTHRLCRLAGVSRRSRRLLGPLRGLLVDG